MHIKCPHCKKKIDLGAVEKNSRLVRAQNILNSLAAAASLVSEYVECFRLPNQTMTDRKRLRLLNEVKTLLDTGEFSIERRQHKVSNLTVIEGIREVVNRNLSGLTSHRYLYRVLAGKAGSRKDEGRRVEEKRSPSPLPSPTPKESGVLRARDNGEPEDEETRAAREDVFEKIRNLGGNLRMDRKEDAMAMKFAQLETSERLQRLHTFLSDGRWHSTKEIIERANVMAVSAAVAELRENGIAVKCRHRPEANNVWEYSIGAANG